MLCVSNNCFLVKLEVILVALTQCGANIDDYQYD